MHGALAQAFGRELRFLRQTASEFARAYPDLAPALAAEEGNPHIARLLEGVAFLSARTALRVDAEYDRLAQDLVQAVAPDLMCTLPPAAMVQFKPLLTLADNARSIVPRDSAVRYQLPDGRELHFRTTADVRLQPIEIEVLPPPPRGEIASTLSRSGGARLPTDLYHGTAIRLSLRAAPGRRLSEALTGSLDLHCCGPHAAWLWRFLTDPGVSLALVDPENAVIHAVHRSGERDGALRPSGWSDAEAMLPLQCALPGPLRLLRESQAWPERFLRLTIDGLQRTLHRWFGDSIELWFLAGEQTVLPALAPDAVRAFCCPVVALTRRRCEPIALGPDKHEGLLRLPADRTAQDIVAVERVEWRRASGDVVPLVPLGHLSTVEGDGTAHHGDACYALRREPGWRTAGDQRGGDRAAGEWEAGDRRAVDRRRGDRHAMLPTVDWMIAPSAAMAEGDMLLVTAWASQRLDGVRADDARHWRLDAVAGVQDIVGVGAPVSPAPFTMPSPAMLLRVLSWRIDRLHGLEPAALATELGDWLRLFCRSERLPVMIGARLSTDIELVTDCVVPVHARGWQLSVDVDARTATTPLFSLWPHILAATLVRQLQAESFVRCRFVHDGSTVGEALAWR